jgi:hypothetical protein
MDKKRKIFFTVASGGHDTDRHFFDTIKTKRKTGEIEKFLTTDEVNQLNKYVHSRPFVAWGAVPGPGNNRTWETMEEGDYVMIYRSGRIISVAEVAMKVKNSEVARFFWDEDKEGKTWELVFFLTNEIEVNVKQPDLNKYLGYGENYFPRGFMSVDQEKANKLLATYGDLISLLQKLESGEKLEEIDIEKKQIFKEVLDEVVKKAPTEHDEMQWRLIRLGNQAHLDVWVPPNDQGRQWDGNKFREHIIKEFREALDVPTYVKNIDTVWKLGLSVKAAFEIENSTSIYSGILRLSDLRSLAPNSNYPLFIVADRNKRSRVFDQLKRPTFSNEYLKLDEVVKFLSYDRIRELDNDAKDKELGLDINWLTERAESVSSDSTN